jgi:hypothetical protein
MKLGVIELSQMFYLNIIYQGNLTQSLLIAKIFSILMPFFIVVIVVDVGLRLYLIFFDSHTVNRTLKKSGSKKHSIGRKFSTIIGITAGKSAATKMSASLAKITLGTLTTVGGAAAIKFVAVDIPDSLPVKLEPNYLQQLYHQNLKYGFRMESAAIHNKYCLMEQAMGKKAANEAITPLGDSKTLTLSILNQAVSDPENAKALKQLNRLEQVYLYTNLFSPRSGSNLMG